MDRSLEERVRRAVQEKIDISLYDPYGPGFFWKRKSIFWPSFLQA